MADEKKTIVTIVYVVTYKDSPKSPKREFTRYTEASAKRFARLIEDEGGIAIITEVTEEVPQDDFDTLPIPPSTRNQLTW